ncbi:MAG TPA: radical SAM protein, partial [Candidatus Altiarchaeales archaeon]|nr:radical SAM protein [Candidatus Altiarchaeales archaeon]HEX54610.1 radical SAM protein [Candidatus Altiarchaeales archaeon]
MNSVYGPVPSWRLGRSLGVDPICGKKVCNFDCIYCQLGRTSRKAERRKFVEADKVREDIERIIDKVSADVITLSGTGEPTLAENLNEIIDVIREMTDLPIAILTNSSLLHKNEIVNEL